MAKRSEHGRGIIEMLGILAIIGLLSLVAFSYFRQANIKKLANAIINDSRVVFLDAKSDEELTDDWQESTHISETGIDFMVMRDVQGNDYVMALNVEMEVCQQMLKMTSPNLLSFFNEDETEMTLCNPVNNIIIAWNGLGKPAECETSNECGDDFEGFCSETGQCQSCDKETEQLNFDGTDCECDPNKALTCEDENGNYWCCKDGMMCDTTNLSCKESDGSCQYTFIQPEYSKQANCSYKVSNQTYTSKANCHYTIQDRVIDEQIHGVDMIEIKGCPADEFCIISHMDETCSSSISRSNLGSSEAENVYGTCIKRTMNGGTCNTTVVSKEVMQEIQGCQEDEYCYVNFFDKECSSSISRSDIGSKQAETVFGVCLKRDMNGGSCNTTTMIAGELQKKLGCPDGQYCYLKWTGDNCSNTISNSASGPLFGVCIDQTKNVAQCPTK